MRLYIFKSESKAELCAFAGDSAGSKLPDRYRPWHAIGVVSADRNPPHGLSRNTIEAALDEHGFQLWRMKTSSSSSTTEGGE